MHRGMAEIVQELRDLISDLRPAVLESLGLVVAAAAHLDQFTTQTGIVSYLEDERDGERVPADIEVTFYRLLQEAITNVRKHAGAMTVWVRFSIYDGLFRMDVTDDGRGFDPAVVGCALPRKRSYWPTQHAGANRNLQAEAWKSTAFKAKALVSRFGHR